MKLGKKMDREKFYFTYPQEENSDWNYGRNKFFLLKRAQGCWSSSLFSVNFRDYLLPNRDYPHQGLLCKVGEEYIKFLDAVMFKLEGEEGIVDLEPTKVQVSPWKVVYYYKKGETKLRVEYFLSETEGKNKLGGWVRFKLDSKDDYRLVVSPLVDIRNIREESGENYELERKDGALKVRRGGNELLFGPVNGFEEKVERIGWKYKLDNGERRKEGKEVHFRETERNPSILGRMEYSLGDGSDLKLGVVCGKEVELEDLEGALSQGEGRDLKRAEEVLDKFSVNDEGLEERFYRPRILTLEKFSTWENNLRIPEAGEWWFKEVWFRDLFESILHNMDFYRKVKGDEWLKKIFNWARMFINDGVMANKPAEKDINYNSLDASFLYLISMSKYYEKAGDESFREKVERAFEAVVDRFGEEDLISCRANYSWLDTKLGGRSTRIPDGWGIEEEENYLLPEINALWIKAMEKYNRICGKEVKVKKLWEKWRNTFWDEEKGFPYQIVYRQGGEEMADPTESSVGIMSVALLLDHFSGNEVLEVWKSAQEKLLVNRTPVFFEKKEMPFGILVKNSEKRIYLGEEQYHEAVSWPRDLPYLFQILRKLGKEEIIREISLNLLDHQMSEGAVFYNHELFSLPEGENPSPERATSKNPVPVKNPAQLWSQFLPPLKNSESNQLMI